jgi:hypothetical protein
MLVDISMRRKRWRGLAIVSGTFERPALVRFDE